MLLYIEVRTLSFTHKHAQKQTEEHNLEEGKEIMNSVPRVRGIKGGDKPRELNRGWPRAVALNIVTERVTYRSRSLPWTRSLLLPFGSTSRFFNLERFLYSAEK